MRAAQAARNGLKHTSVHPDVVSLPEAKEQHAVSQRRWLDNERQLRIFDPKVRTIGIDRQKLDEQVMEKARMRELEQATEDFQNKMAVQQDKHAQALERESQLIRLQKEKDLNNYRDTFQKKEAGREFDLNDPLGKKKDLPARVGDYDPRNGVASMQRFEGEDLNGRQRKLQQARQMQHWVKQQQDEKAMKKFLEDQNDRLWENRAEEINKRAWDMDKLQKEQKKQATMTNAEFNRQLALQRKREADEQRRQELRENHEELANNLDSDFLGETARAGGNGRRDRMKGLSHDQLQAIRNEQAQQREELRQRRIREAEEEKAAAAAAEQQRMMGQALEQQMALEKRNLAKRLMAENQQQHRDALQKKAETKRLYAPEVGEQYFQPFLPANFDICAEIQKTTR